MASNSGRTSNISNADSGFGSNIHGSVDPRYACNWTDECRGDHELHDCVIRREELRGKLGIYHSASGVWRRFRNCRIGHNLPLDNNPTGCTMVHILIYTVRDKEPWILFTNRWLNEERSNYQRTSNRQLLLAFPAFYPSKRGEYLKTVALNALKTVIDWEETIEQFRSRLHGFLFVNANAIYPLRLTNEQADDLTKNFSANDISTSLHWFSLSTILGELPQWDFNLDPPPFENELPQVSRFSCTDIHLCEGNQQYTMWSFTAFALNCIKYHIGFDNFFQLKT